MSALHQWLKGTCSTHHQSVGHSGRHETKGEHVEERVGEKHGLTALPGHHEGRHHKQQ